MARADSTQLVQRASPLTGAHRQRARQPFEAVVAPAFDPQRKAFFSITGAIPQPETTTGLPHSIGSSGLHHRSIVRQFDACFNAAGPDALLLPCSCEGPSKSRHTCNSHRSLRAISFSRERKAVARQRPGTPVFLIAPRSRELASSHNAEPEKGVRGRFRNGGSPSMNGGKTGASWH